jgi:3-phenylpropionate/trans-cinnamate dioxygenase ferredoxin reductase subunit
MDNYKYIIVGGGMTADSAVSGIRESDKTGTIAVFSEEKDPPYNRPPLSKSLWKGEPIDSIWRVTTSKEADFFGSTIVVAIDPQTKSVRTSGGKVYHYEQLLLATGGRPRNLSRGRDDVIYYRTIEDYRKLRTLCGESLDFVVIGGGFIGSEIAAALTMNGKNVTMIFPEDGIGSKVYPHNLSLFLNEYYKEKGVNIVSGEHVEGIERKGRKFLVSSARGGILTDAVIGGIGIVPNVDLAKQAGLSTDNGIIVDDLLRTSNPDIYAAGDVANFYSNILEKRVRVEHEDNANRMGKIAGSNMAGLQIPYNHLPFFYSDLFELGYEAIGELDSRLEIIQDWQDMFRKGVIYYCKEGFLRGVLLWNIFGKVDYARELIASKKKFDPRSLKNLITD